MGAIRKLFTLLNFSNVNSSTISIVFVCCFKNVMMKQKTA